MAGSAEARFLNDGYVHLPAEAGLAAWAQAARPVARAAVADPAQRRWLDCEGTWFVGVDALPNGPDGAVNGSGPLRGAALALAVSLYGALALHKAQVSVVFPGYPRPRRGESDAGFRYRLRRDAAHVDGLLPVGPDRRRHLREPHAFILGVPLTEAAATAAPLVVWTGSHTIMRDAFSRALADIPPASWPDVDLTDTYTTARRRVFDTCRREPLPARPGEAVLVHRLAVHGVAAWDEGAAASAEGRAIAYFRPEFPAGGDHWVTAP